MSNPDWLKIKEVFYQTLDLPEAEREEFLAQQNDSVRTEIEELLKADEQAEKFIAEPAVVEFGLNSKTLIGQKIGNYKLLEIIGTGGMGTVFLAEKVGLEKKFAVKLIKRGMDTDEVLRRFKLERKILARLEHPNIAPLLDGGMTDDGLPFLVMEYVEGVSITRFCDTNELEIKERLKLFRAVCSAVSYAHQNLIIHRDLKPSNILVTKDGTPKLLDFGIAKLRNPDGFEDTATTMQARMFTPEYASPEQLNGLPITTASDVYSLGVVLYELLSGQRPFQSNSRNYQEIVEQILNNEPVRPSVISNFKFQISNSKSEGATLQNNEQRNTNDEQKSNPKSQIPNPKSLKGDLDNIILKALRKETERRYNSVQEFSEDLRRHLAGLPVTATADTSFYRFSKFVQRHKVGTAIMALILLLSGISVWQGVVANRERAKAERRLIETRKIANSLMFEIHDSLAALPGATASREILVNRALEYLDALSQESDANPELLKELATAYRKVGDVLGNINSSSLGQMSNAFIYYEKAHQIQNELLASNPQDVDLMKEFAATNYALSLNYYNSKGDINEALKYCRISQKTLEFVSRSEPNQPEWKNQLAKIYDKSSEMSYSINDSQKAEEDTQISIKYNDEAIALAPQNTKLLASSATVYSNIGRRLGDTYYNDQGKPDEALVFLEKALAIKKTLCEIEPNNAPYKRSLGVVYRDLGLIYTTKKDFPKAIENFQKASAIFDELAGKDEKDWLSKGNIALNLMLYGESLRADGKLDDALILQKKSVEMFEAYLENDPESIGMMVSFSRSLEFLADTLKSKNKNVESLDVYQRSVKFMLKPYEKVATFETTIPLARLYLKIGKLKQSNPSDCQTAFEHFQKSYVMLEDFKQKDRLSPTNTETYLEANQLAKSFKCG